MNSSSEAARPAAHRLRIGAPLTESLKLFGDAVQPFGQAVMDGRRQRAEAAAAAVGVAALLGGLRGDRGQRRF